MSDNEEKEVPDVEVDYSKYDEDSVPIPEKVITRLITSLSIVCFQPIEHTHEGRPDLDYDDTPVGPAPTEEEEDDEKKDDWSLVVQHNVFSTQNNDSPVKKTKKKVNCDNRRGLRMDELL